MKVHIGEYNDNANGRDVEIEVEETDAWNLDCTLSHVIAAGLRKFKEMLTREDGVRSYPGCLITSKDEFGNPTDGDAGYDLWIKELDEMIWAFDQQSRSDPDEPDYAPGPNNPCVLYHERKRAAFELFGKRYGDLWI